MELALVLIQVLERHPGFTRFAVDDCSEALHEGATTGVLSGEPDCSSLKEQGAKSENLGGGPVDWSLGDRRSTTLQLRHHLWMDGESVWECSVRVCDLLQCLHGDRGAVLGGRLLGVRRNSAVFHLTRRLTRPTYLIEDSLQALLEAAHHGLGVLDGDITAADQGLRIELADRPLLLDQVIHPRLGKARVVAFVVTATAVADQ